MSWFAYDPDEWATIPGEYKELGCYPGTNVPLGFASGPTQRRRHPDEVRRMKAERERQREDYVLAEAERIKAKRAAEPRSR